VGITKSLERLLKADRILILPIKWDEDGEGKYPCVRIYVASEGETFSLTEEKSIEEESHRFWDGKERFYRVYNWHGKPWESSVLKFFLPGYHGTNIHTMDVSHALTLSMLLKKAGIVRA